MNDSAAKAPVARNAAAFDEVRNRGLDVVIGLSRLVPAASCRAARSPPTRMASLDGL
jgi:hypothetical protein